MCVYVIANVCNVYSNIVIICFVVIYYRKSFKSILFSYVCWHMKIDSPYDLIKSISCGGQILKFIVEP